MDTQRLKYRWLRKTTIWLPRWQLLVCLLILLLGLLTWIFKSANRFLSLNRPVPANVLIVEGWLPDNALREAVAHFRSGSYGYLVTSGGPVEIGSFLSSYDNYAALAGARLRKLGIPGDRLIEAPAARTFRNRTFESAKGVRAKLEDLRITINGLNVVSEGPHARRTGQVYRRVFRRIAAVGVIAADPQDYDPNRWWSSSEGVKSTLAEGLAWAYEQIR